MNRNALLICAVAIMAFVGGSFASPSLISEAHAKAATLIKVNTDDLSRCNFDKQIVMARGGGMDIYICVSL